MSWSQCEFYSLHYGYFLLLEESQKQGIRSWATMSRGFTVLLFLVAFTKLQKVTISFVISVCLSVRLFVCLSHCLHGTTRLSLDWFFMKFDIWAFLKNLLRKFKFYYHLTSVRGILLEDCCMSLTISRSVLLRVRNVSDKYCTENQDTHCMSNDVFLKILPFVR